MKTDKHCWFAHVLIPGGLLYLIEITEIRMNVKFTHERKLQNVAFSVERGLCDNEVSRAGWRCNDLSKSAQ